MACPGDSPGRQTFFISRSSDSVSRIPKDKPDPRRLAFWAWFARRWAVMRFIDIVLISEIPFQDIPCNLINTNLLYCY